MTGDDDPGREAADDDPEQGAADDDPEQGAADDDPEQGAFEDLAQEAADDGPNRYDRVERHATPGERNSLRHWTDAKSPLVVAYNYLLVWIARVAPSLRVRNWALSAMGVDVGDGVAWGLEATTDVFWPERITLGDHAIVGYDATLLCHAFLQDEYRVGDVDVGERAMIGADVVVLPGVEIGEGAQVAANSLVDDDVAPETTVAGVPAEPVDDETEPVGDDDAAD